MKKKLIIMGSAPCLTGDLFELHKIVEFENCDFMAIGLDCADRYLGRIEHVATYHPDDLTEFRNRREAAGGNLDYVSHSHTDCEEGKNIIFMYPVDRIWPFAAPSGSSAMLGVEVGIGLGYEKIVVAGCPLVDRKYTVKSDFRIGWTHRYDKIKNNVRSMSGWTRGLLGAPTKEWLDG